MVCFFSEKDIRQTTGWTVLHPLSPENFDIDTISRHVEDKKGLETMQILKDRLKVNNMNAFCVEKTGSVNEGRTVDLQ